MSSMASSPQVTLYESAPCSGSIACIFHVPNASSASVDGPSIELMTGSLFPVVNVSTQRQPIWQPRLVNFSHVPAHELAVGSSGAIAGHCMAAVVVATALPETATLVRHSSLTSVRVL